MVFQVTQTPEERFWPKVEKTDNCWTWKGAKSNGYGLFGYNGKVIPAHRFAYELLKRKIPEGFVLDHLCRNHSCVNPDHLEITTDKINILRGIGACAKNAIKTHCKRGHEFTEESTHLCTSGSRRCRTCTRENKKNWLLKNHEYWLAYRNRWYALNKEHKHPAPENRVRR